jgi:hypothetical protein
VFLIYLDDQKWKGGEGEWNDQGLITSLDVGKGILNNRALEAV